MLTKRRTAFLVPLLLLGGCEWLWGSGGGGGSDPEPEATLTCSGQPLDGFSTYTFGLQGNQDKCMAGFNKEYIANSLSEARGCVEDEYPGYTAAQAKDVCTLAYGHTISGNCTPTRSSNIASGGRSALENQKLCERFWIGNCAQGNCSYNDVTNAFVQQTVPGGCAALVTNGSALDNAC